MAKGYHSRSPEELQEYLNNLKKKSPKKNWKNALVFIDILLLMVVFYMVSKFLNPGSDINLKSSNKINHSGLELYLTKSNTKTSDMASYFLFLNNKSEKKQTFPIPKKAELEYKSETNMSCFKKEIFLESKTVASLNRDYLILNILKIHKDTLPEDCKNLYKVPSFPRTVYTVFDFSKKYRVDTILKLEMQDGAILELILPDDSW